MATKQCPNSAKKIQDDATVCKHCGQDLVALANPPAQTPRWPIAMFVIGIIIAVIGIVIVAQMITMIGLVIGALGGYIWRIFHRRARAQL